MRSAASPRRMAEAGSPRCGRRQRSISARAPRQVSPTVSLGCGHSYRPTARWRTATRPCPALFSHAGAAVHRRKASRFRADLTRLIQKLSDILHADFARSADGHSAENLRAAIGQPQAQAFDFAAMSRMLASVSQPSLLADSRRERIRWLLSVLQSQRFYVPSQHTGAPPQALPGYGFVFDSCSQALEAWHERLPRLVELTRAIAIAELEVKGAYREAQHDAVFASFGTNGLGTAELARFPDYLVRLDADTLAATEFSRVLDALATGLPLKFLLQTDDLLAPLADGPARASFGLCGRTVTSAAIALNEAFVLQSSASHLPSLRDRVFAGLAAPARRCSRCSPARAATPLTFRLICSVQRRWSCASFRPSFTTPRLGPWAARFSLAGNAQLEQDFPVHALAYEDADHQRVAETVAFTAADFLACDRRYAAHFARVPRADWNGQMVEAAEAIARDSGTAGDAVPYLLMVDAGNRLQKVMADDRMIREARRVDAMWRGLRELGGIRNSHAARLFAGERAAFEAELQRHVAVTNPAVAQMAAPAPSSAAAPAAQAGAISASAAAAVEDAVADPERSPDEPHRDRAVQQLQRMHPDQRQNVRYNKDNRLISPMRPPAPTASSSRPPKAARCP